MDNDLCDGSLIAEVLAGLVERVSRLEAQRPEVVVRVNKAAIRAEMVRLYLDPSQPSVGAIAQQMGYSLRGVRNNLQAAGVYGRADKKEVR